MSNTSWLFRAPILRSFYWRIGLSFVVFLVAVIAAQSLMFSYTIARWNALNPERAPNNLASNVAAQIGAALEANPALDLGPFLVEHHGSQPTRMFVVMKDGRVAGNSSEALSDELRRAALAAVAGTDLKDSGGYPRFARPVVTAPVQVNGELRGLVVLPSRRPGGVAREVGRLLSLPGTLLLIAATSLAALFIFAPARRRLAALEQATERLGHGDLEARAPEEGGDEIARVAQSFNRMAADLAARNEALQRSDALRRQMLADVSHELKTPLTAMRGYLDTLQMPHVGDADRARYFGIIERETRRLERIVADLLDLARYESGAGSLDVRVFAIERLFEHVVRRNERDAESRGVSLFVRVDEAADQVVADPHRMEQAIDNLVANALRHTPRGGVIALEASADEHGVSLSVVDSGEGISSDHVAHVFDRFYKVDPARGGGAGGSGLGLSIVKAIVERHGGTVSVVSRPGRTAFTIFLPQPSGDSTPSDERTGEHSAHRHAHAGSANG